MANADLIKKLLAEPEKLLQTKPYYRNVSFSTNIYNVEKQALIGTTVTATLPNIRRTIIPICQLLKEYDPYSHSVLYDENIPSLTVKNAENGWINIEQKRMPIPFQQNIAKKQTLHLCNNPMSHLLLNSNPTEKQKNHFIKIKQIWDERNLDGIKTEAVLTQKSESVVGVLFYHDQNGRIKARILKYSDGFVIITHKNENGEHILECVYYKSNDTEYIDCYDNNYLYRFTNSFDFDSIQKEEIGWKLIKVEKHGYSEIPLVTKRGKVAWDNVQDLIEVYERTYNTFMVIQNRYGWGVLYVKGRFNSKAQKINGNVVLNDSSGDANADAKILNPPSPENMIQTLEQMEYSIQKGSGTTFILPKDISMSGDTSGLAVQLTQELDIETALQDVNDWQNFANKMMRLFKEGLARELLATGDPDFDTAMTDFATLNIRTKFSVWRPQSAESYNQMLCTLKGAGAISAQTLIEKNTESCPDEMARVKKENDEIIEKSIIEQNVIQEDTTNTEQ